VALMALLTAVEAGAQGALLAPTEILARQHFDTLSRQLAGLPVNVAILTGREKGRAREATLMGLRTARFTYSSAPTPFSAGGGLQAARPRGGRRAAPVSESPSE
jgi:hypothetical protein